MFDIMYEEQLKDEWSKIWEERLQALPPAGPQKAALKKRRVRERQKWLSKKYEEASEDIRKDVMKQVEEEYTEAMAEWEKRAEWSGVKEDYIRLVILK